MTWNAKLSLFARGKSGVLIENSNYMFRNISYRTVCHFCEQNVCADSDPMTDGSLLCVTAGGHSYTTETEKLKIRKLFCIRTEEWEKSLPPYFYLSLSLHPPPFYFLKNSPVPSSAFWCLFRDVIKWKRRNGKGETEKGRHGTSEEADKINVFILAVCSWQSMRGLGAELSPDTFHILANLQMHMLSVNILMSCTNKLAVLNAQLLEYRTHQQQQCNQLSASLFWIIGHVIHGHTHTQIENFQNKQNETREKESLTHAYVDAQTPKHTHTWGNSLYIFP